MTWLEVRQEDDIAQVSQAVRGQAETLGLRTAYVELVVREMAWNLIRHAGGGAIGLDEVGEGDRTGLRVTSLDRGPGIIAVAGRQEGSGLGLGLSVIRRHCDEL
ncbi:MAG TPA: anti-sigma regulatory factor, partial [Candidatus Xenobia bacterium]